MLGEGVVAIGTGTGNGNWKGVMIHDFQKYTFLWGLSFPLLYVSGQILIGKCVVYLSKGRLYDMNISFCI
jgi:hypothetical protein